MVKTITPFSTRAKEGATDSPLGDFVNVDQAIVSTADVGSYDLNTGKLTGVPSSDIDFILYQKDEAIAHTASFLTSFGLDMTGYKDIQMAIRTTATGNYAMEAVMGSSGSQNYGGLTPLNDAAILKGTMAQTIPVDMESLFGDGSVALTQDVWNIFYIGSTLRNQKLLQFKITNNSGSQVDVETTFLRVV